MPVTVLCASSGQGKTTFLCDQAAHWVEQGRTVGGVASPCVFATSERIGYDLLDLRSRVRRPLARVGETGPAGPTAGVYRFDPDALAAGNAAITEAVRAGLEIIVIDEVGPLELRWGGWAPALQFVLHTGYPAQRLVITVRPSLVDELPTRFPANAWASACRVVPPWPAVLRV